MEPGCPVLVPFGRCPVHRLAKLEDPVVRKWYRLARWLALRDLMLQVDPFCRQCLREGRKVLTAEIDHIVPHEGVASRFWDAGNLQGLCKSCHSKKTRDGR